MHSINPKIFPADGALPLIQTHKTLQFLNLVELHVLGTPSYINPSLHIYRETLKID